MKPKIEVIGKTDVQTALINELPQLVQSRVAFDRLNGSMGNITAYNGRDGSQLMRRKSKCVCPGTAPQSSVRRDTVPPRQPWPSDEAVGQLADKALGLLPAQAGIGD